MVAEILLIPGSNGEALRSSAQFVGRELSAAGVKVREQISLCTDTLKLQQAVATGLGRSNMIVVLGGMGRESGFLAKNVVGQGLGMALEPNRECLGAIQAYCKRTGEPFDVDDLDLASLPKGAKPFPPTFGKLPGCLLSSSRQHIILLPENPQEISPMFHHYVQPLLQGVQTSTTVSRTLRTYGLPEEQVREKLRDLAGSSNPMLTVQKEGNEVLVRVTAHGSTGQQAAAMCTPVLRSIVDRLGNAAYGLDVNSMQEAVVQKMRRKSLDIAVAEAGMEGMLTRALSETEGGREVLRYTVAADDREAKVSKLGARAKLLKKRGDVSEYASVAMAAGAMEHLDGDGVGIGVCANSSDYEDRKCPAGQVYIAVCNGQHVYVKKLVVGDGTASTEAIIDAALSRALNILRLFIDALPRKLPGSIDLGDALEGRQTVTDKGKYDEAPEEPVFEPEDGGEEPARASGGKLRKFVLVLAVLIFLGSGGYLGKQKLDSFLAARLANQLENVFDFGDMGEVELSPDYPKDYLIKFAGLWNMNPDVVAYIRIPDTGVKYPIVQASDNDYYLRRDFNGNSSQHGVPFMDYRVNVKAPSDNLVVYGHNMKDGQIFGELMNYKGLDYYKEHPVIEFATVYDESKYKIVSVFLTNAYENGGEIFPYNDFIDAGSDQAFNDFIYQVQARSLIHIPVDVQPGDQLITLSSCSYEFTDARFVVVARKLRRGESATVDVDSATMAANPLMPDIWYQINGGTKPDVRAYTAPVSLAAAGTEYSLAVANTLAEVNRLEVSQAIAEKESSRQESAAEASRLASEAEASRLASEAEASRAAASQAEASRLASEAEASRLASEAEASRLASEAEASRLASEAEASRLASEAEEASRLASEAEASRLASEAEASRLASEAEESRLALEAAQQQRAGASAGFFAGETLEAYVNGSLQEMDAFELVAGIVQNEMGSSFHKEALKAQAVASYTYVLNSLDGGSIPSVYASSSISSMVEGAVAEVFGEAVLYQGRFAFTPYHATSAGSTTSASSVWGGNYSYLTAVDSSVDKRISTYESSLTMTSDKVANLLWDKLGIEADGDPESWFDILNYTDGGYNGDMAVCGYTKSQVTGSTLTGRLLRETVFNLRSACFTVEYNDRTDKFTFTTYGYGHGVGMSQNGANLYAQQGWSYVDILEHYYPGTTVG